MEIKECLALRGAPPAVPVLSISRQIQISRDMRDKQSCAVFNTTRLAEVTTISRGPRGGGRKGAGHECGPAISSSFMLNYLPWPECGINSLDTQN